MARLSTYLNDNSISGEDLLAGSNFVSFNAYETKNFKIKDLTEYIQGQISISPSNSTLKANGGIVTEIISGTNSLAVDLSATDITGQLANSDLANSSITINGTAVALGGSITIGEITGVTAGTYINGGGTEGTVTVNHDNTTRTNATSTASPAYGASFTAIDSLTTNTTGHVTAVNTKTITLPASDDTTYTVEAVASTNDSIIRLIDSDSNNDDIKLIAGDNISLSTNEANDTITINSQAFGTVFTVATKALMIAATTTGGDIVIRTDVSKTFIHNGGTVGDETDFSELQFSGINSIDLTEGVGIDLSRTGTGALTNINNDLTITNNLATTTTRGGIQIGYTESGKNYPVELDSEQAYVNVPWINTNQLTTFTVRDSGDDDKLVAHDDFIKFVSATGTAGTDLSGTGTTSDPFVMTITSPDENTEYTAGGGLDLNDTVFSHTDTSTQASVDNSGRTYIQDITLDTYGHVTGLVSATETVTDTNRLTTWDLLDDDDDSFTIDHDTHVKFTSSEAAYGTNVTGSGTEADPYIVAVTSPNDTVPNTFRTIKVDTNNDGTANETIGATEELKLIGGTNVTLAEDAGKVTVTSSDTTNWNLTIESVSPGENITAGDTIAFKEGDRIGLSQSNKEITISGDILTLTDLNTVTGGMTGDDTLTFGDDGDDTSVVIRGNLQVAGTTTTNNVETVSTSNGIIFEGTVADAHELKLLAGALTADRTVTIPDASFTIPTENTQLSKETVQDYVGEMFAGNTETRIAVTYDDNNNKVNFVVDDMTDQRTDEEIRDVTVAMLTAGSNIILTEDDAANTLTIAATDTTTNYYLDGITKSGNKLIFSVNGANNPEYTFGSNAFNSTTIPTNNNQITNGAGYITSYSETDTLANVVSRGNSTNGTLEVTGTGSWLTVEGNAANTSVPLSQGLAFGWNRSGGSNETEIIFKGSTSGHSSRLDIRSYDGTNFRTLAQFEGDESIVFPNAGNIVAQENGAERILERSYDGARWARLVSNNVGGELQLGRSNSAHVKIVTLGDSYLNGGDVGIGQTSPAYKLDVDGTIRATGDVIAYSDKRVKENIKTIDNALEKVVNLRGVEFNKIGENKKSIGVIAQEVEKVLPEVISTDKKDMKSVAYGNITGVLIEAIKELKREIEELKKQIK